MLKNHYYFLLLNSKKNIFYFWSQNFLTQNIVKYFGEMKNEQRFKWRWIQNNGSLNAKMIFAELWCYNALEYPKLIVKVNILYVVIARHFAFINFIVQIIIFISAMTGKTMDSFSGAGTFGYWQLKVRWLLGGENFWNKFWCQGVRYFKRSKIILQIK